MVPPRPQQPPNKRVCVSTVGEDSSATVPETVLLEDAAARTQISRQDGEESCVSGPEACVNEPTGTQNFTVTGAPILRIAEHSDEANDFGPFAADSDEEELNPDQPDDDNNNNTKYPSHELIDDFMAYSEWAAQNTCELSPDMEAGIKLLHMLSTKRVPLKLYDEIFKWHTENITASKFIPMDRLITTLTKRYNLKKTAPFIKKLELPHSKARIKLVCHDAKAQIQSLLVDPRFEDEDYLFMNDNPREGPPEEWTHVSDINTGRAYRETWKHLIKDPEKEILLPIIFYMDEAVAGNFGSLPVEALKMTLGIFNSNTRNKVYAWKNLGMITHFLKEDTQGIDFVKESEHIDACHYLSDESDNKNNEHKHNFVEENPVSDTDGEDASDVALPACSAQDLHTMMDNLLESYRELQDNGGFHWNLRYKGKTYPSILVPFCIFVKGDSVEHDKHCGSYTSRGQYIQQLCRYCCCKNAETDDPYHKAVQKTREMIKPLIKEEDSEGLRALSQQLIQNCWYHVLFGCHNKCGIHGACPLEILHWFQLGKYKYSRACFFSQTGKDSIVGNLINALAITMGFFFKRQSDRDLPRTMFSKGIKKGKLQAHEMQGLVLVLLACIHTARGREILLTESRGKQKEYFGDEEKIANWTRLLETYLQWEAWLNLPTLSVFDITRSRTKVREILAMEKRTCQRDTGMEFRTFNFHAAIHVADDMLDFGVPGNVNTSSNEMHHKPSKSAALRTQKRQKCFDFQCATQLHYIDVVDLGMQEVLHDKKPWLYAVNEPTVLPTIHDTAATEENSSDREENTGSKKSVLTVGGTRCDFLYSEETGKYISRVKSRMKDRHKFHLGKPVEQFLESVLEVLGDEVKILHIHTEHTRDSTLFRGSPRFLGKPWRDWAMINWGNGIKLPGQIWCFVDLRDIPHGSFYEPSIYAVIESADKSKKKKDLARSSMFVPYFKEIAKGKDSDGNAKRKFYLVDADSIVSTACVIPDIGNSNPAAFLRLLPKSEWSNQFISWLRTPHSREFTE